MWMKVCHPGTKGNHSINIVTASPNRNHSFGDLISDLLHIFSVFIERLVSWSSFRKEEERGIAKVEKRKRLLRSRFLFNCWSTIESRSFLLVAHDNCVVAGNRSAVYCITFVGDRISCTVGDRNIKYAVSGDTECTGTCHRDTAKLLRFSNA